MEEQAVVPVTTQKKKVVEVEFPAAESHWEAFMEYVWTRLEGDEFCDMLAEMRDHVSDEDFARLLTELSRSGCGESVADFYFGDFGCPGDGPWLRERIEKAVVAKVYFFADGSALQVSEDELRVCGKSDREEQEATQPPVLAETTTEEAA